MHGMGGPDIADVAKRRRWRVWSERGAGGKFFPPSRRRVFCQRHSNIKMPEVLSALCCDRSDIRRDGMDGVRAGARLLPASSPLPSHIGPSSLDSTSLHPLCATEPYIPPSTTVYEPRRYRNTASGAGDRTSKMVTLRISLVAYYRLQGVISHIRPSSVRHSCYHVAWGIQYWVAL